MSQLVYFSALRKIEGKLGVSNNRRKSNSGLIELLLENSKHAEILVSSQVPSFIHSKVNDYGWSKTFTVICRFMLQRFGLHVPSKIYNEIYIKFFIKGPRIAP